MLDNIFNAKSSYNIEIAEDHFFARIDPMGNGTNYYLYGDDGSVLAPALGKYYQIVPNEKSGTTHGRGYDIYSVTEIPGEGSGDHILSDTGILKWLSEHNPQ